MRQFETGATRDTDENKFDYEGFISPLVLQRFGAYMHQHRLQADGNLRASDNWQKGIPTEAYMKSMLRHVHDVWMQHRGYEGQDSLEESLCAVLFNVQGYLFELLKEKRNQESTEKSFSHMTLNDLLSDEFGGMSLEERMKGFDE